MSYYLYESCGHHPQEARSMSAALPLQRAQGHPRDAIDRKGHSAPRPFSSLVEATELAHGVGRPDRDVTKCGYCKPR